MPELKDILKEKQDRLNSVPDALLSAADKTQKVIIKELLTELDGLDRTPEGKFEINSNNLSRISGIAEKLQKVIFDSDYGQALTEFAKEFSAQAKLSNSIYTILDDQFENKEIYKKNLSNATSQTIDLLNGTAINQAFINPIKDILMAAITTGQSMSDAMKSLQQVIEGDTEKLGKLSGYIKQVAYDGFAVSDRQYMQLVSNDIGYEFYEYNGGEMKSTRYFCHLRHGNIYHKKEIEEWGNDPDLWDAPTGSEFHGGGMADGTNSSTIFSFCGGYECQHLLIPVPISRVPIDVIARAKVKGFFRT